MKATETKSSEQAAAFVEFFARGWRIGATEPQVSEAAADADRLKGDPDDEQ